MDGSHKMDTREISVFLGVGCVLMLCSLEQTSLGNFYDHIIFDMRMYLLCSVFPQKVKRVKVSYVIV